MNNFTQHFKTLIFSVTIMVSLQLFSQSTAEYSITFSSVWESVAVDPTNGNSIMPIPGNAHWSNLVGTTHNANYTMVEMGTLASTGIKDVAELGNNDELFAEVSTQISNGNADQWLQEPFSPFAAISGATLDNVTVSSDFPLLSLVAMIAPSPDWMIAVNSINLRENNAWRSSVSIPLYAYDAGTDSGTMYTSGDVVTNPAQPISILINQGPFNANPIGTLTISLVEVLSTDEFNEETVLVYPNPSNGILNIKTPNNLNMSTIDVFDVIGQQVRSSKIKTTNPSFHELNLSDLNSGVYLVRIEMEDGSNSTRRILLN